MSKGSGLDLSVTVPALEFARLTRRVKYLEAVLVQALRSDRRIKEWYSAEELAELRLPGLPASRSTISRMARQEGWMTDKVPCQGGARHVYHFSCLPRRSFEAMLDLVLRNPPPPEETASVPALPPAPLVVGRQPDNTAPPWVLPLMRIIRTGQSVEEALHALPAALPAGTHCPSAGEAMEVLKKLGYACR